MEYQISVIVPVYNAEQYIIETLESVKKQSLGFERIQLIVVDDCSTDSSYDLVSKWSEGYDNVTLTRTDSNSGSPALPRNMGLDLAIAPYVMFLDNDDSYTEDACRLLLEEIENNDADIVSGDSELMSYGKGFTEEERKKLLWSTANIPEGVHKLSEGIEEWVVPFLNNHWCKIYRRSIIEKYSIRSLEGEIWEDILFLFCYLSVSDKCVYIKKPIVRYRARKTSLSHDHNVNFYKSIPRSMDFGKAWADRHNVTERYLAFVNYGFGVTEYYIDEMLGNTDLTEEEEANCIAAWKGPLIYCGDYGSCSHSVYCRILSDDMKRGEESQAVFHFRQLKELYLQRKQEIDNIRSSKFYKLSQLADKILRRGS